MRVRKLKDEWKPSENKSLQVGEIIDITDPKALVEQGMAVYVDEDDVDYERVPIAWEYRPRSKADKIVEQRIKSEVSEEEKKRLIKERRLENLRKARQIKYMKEAEKKMKEQEKKANAALVEAVKIMNEQPL